jgi:hypothetical protein
MIDVRNAIARILDRYTLEDVVSVTLRKMKRNGVVPVFATPAFTASRGSHKSTTTKPSRTLHANPLDGLFALLETEDSPIHSRS